MVDKFTINDNSKSGVSSLNIRIRELRKSKNWSQAELGLMLANILKLQDPIPTSTIASWEHKDVNLCKVPSDDKIYALSKLFHVTVDYLRGFTTNPHQTLDDLLKNPSNLKPVKIIPQELAQHTGEPIWINSDKYTGWMLLCHNFSFIDPYGHYFTKAELLSNNAIFSVFPPYNVYLKHIYNKTVIPFDKIQDYSRVWVAITSPDSSLQTYNGWYDQLPDGSGVQGKTLLSYDSYFDFWIAYTSPIQDVED